MQKNIEEYWTKEWDNAYNFFKSKGNLNTISKLKTKWKKEFIEMMKEMYIS